MAKASTPRSIAKRDAILDAAQVLFLEQGYTACSMDTVSQTAGVSKATIYAHFSGKDALFAAVMQRRCEESFAFCLPDETLDARAALTLIGQRLLDLMNSPEALALFRVVVTESVRSPDLARAFYETGPVRGKANIAAVLERLVERGELQRHDVARTTDQFIGMLRAEAYHRALLGLPEGRGVAATVADAVDTVLRAWGR